MRKKVLLLLATLFTCSTFTLGISACKITIGGNSSSEAEQSSDSQESSEENFSEGLSYKLLNDDTYEVSGMGDCTDTEIIIPSSYNEKAVTYIGEAAFYCCESLTSIEIPDSVTTIGNSAFGDCDSLTNIEIPDSVTSIGEYAFYDCNSLTSVIIGDGVTATGKDAFSNCDNLTNVTCSAYAVSHIPKSNLQTVIITSGALGYSAFRNCDSLTSVVIGDGVTSIGEMAFFSCDSLTSVYYGGAAEDWSNIEIGSYNSWLIAATKYFYIEKEEDVPADGGNYWHYGEQGEIVVWENSDDSGDEETGTFSQGLSYTLLEDDTYEVSGIGDCTDTEIIIPSSYHDKAVTSIGMEAFKKCKSLTSVVLPDSVKVISESAFILCEGLTSVTIPNGVISIGVTAFGACSILSSITIPESVTFIHYSAFVSCNHLTEFKVSENNATYKAIDGNLYSKDGATLKTYAYGKTATEFTIPNGVTSIGDGAFAACTSLTSVTIPESVTSIGEHAFYGCDSLTSITFNGTVEEWNAIEKGREWNDNVPATKVVCSGEEVSL